jgi:acyl-CoA dehydrogenase
MILIPMDTPGVRVVRPLPVFNYDDAPHGYVASFFGEIRGEMNPNTPQTLRNSI